jgi:hypothetical protein
MAAVASQISLCHLDYDLKILVRFDASTIGLGAMLLNVIRTADGAVTERVVAVLSHAFTDVELRLKTIEQECFGLVYALRHWYQILWGSIFEVETDHRNLTYIHGGGSAKVTRWSLALQGLAYTVRHIAGEDNVYPDRLSRDPALLTDSIPGLAASCHVLPEWSDFDEIHSISFADPTSPTVTIQCAPARTRRSPAIELGAAAPSFRSNITTRMPTTSRTLVSTRFE